VGLYHEGWLLSTKVNRAPWEAFGPANPDPVNNQVLELYDLNKDFSQSHGISPTASGQSERDEAMFIEEARKYQVFPWMLRSRPASWLRAPTSPPAAPSSFTPGRWSACRRAIPRSLLNSSYTITAEIDVPQGGAEGMILTSGGRFAGYGFYLLKGKPVFLWNLIDLKRIKWEGPDALAPASTRGV
jgi:hypothetical protein